jgi:ApbE superfamily uncharacterized protein (UPF0280 family)
MVSFTVQVEETDLHIRARRNLKRKALKAVVRHRSSLERYIKGHPVFLSALEPITVGPDAPYIVRSMALAAAETGVGPMAAVAGAIAECVGEDLLDFSPEVIVENGGDIFLKSCKKRVIGIYAGESPFTGKLALEVDPEQTPLGICSSSGTVGHSLSFGRADAVVVLSPSTSLADATATRIGNMVNDDADIPKAVEFAQNVEGLKGVVIIVGDKLGLWGDVKLSPLEIGSKQRV